jgi:sugar/nucleoside kinase (ribokinase family)
MLRGGNERLLRAAREAGLATSIDLNWDPLWGRAPDDVVETRKRAVREVLHLVDLAHGNARELCEIAGSRELRDALGRIEGWGAGAVVVHLGAEGAGFFEKGELIVEPAAPTRTAVETTGTGDVLSVCLMLLHNRSDLRVREKLRIANRIVAEFMEGRRPLIPEV